MNRVTELHSRAMDLYENVYVKRRAGAPDQGDLNEWLHQAYRLEREAALLLQNEYGEEPTRSVLLRSAASLGLQCHEYREAERLIALGLAGNPPDEIAAELRDLWEQSRVHLPGKKAA